MEEFKSFSKRLETLTLDHFEDFALELAQFQAIHNPIYAAYLKARKIQPSSIQKLEDIPFLPIQFFKDSQVYCGNPENATQVYSSSGTTGAITSKHLQWSEEFYLSHAIFGMDVGYFKKCSQLLVHLLTNHLPPSSLHPPRFHHD